ncbi:MAG: EAL domain-containing protein [bacterium]
MGKEQLKILIVDDDEDDYVMTRDLLSEVHGSRFKLDWETSYESALNTLGSNNHDVCLMDYRLGEHNGLQLLNEAIAKGCRVPIIMMTGQGDQAIDMEAMKAGAEDYLVKGTIQASMLERSIRYAIERRKAKEQIRQIAYYDHLTHLPNRVLFLDRFKHAIAHAGRYHRIAAVMFFDLDNFKHINDTLGHSAGDELLKKVADRLAGLVRKTDYVARLHTDNSGDTIARLGGDEFTLLLTEITHFRDAVKVVQRIHDTLSEPFVLSGQEVFVTASIGIAIYPDDGNDIETLLKNADAAMYHAKEHGKNNFQFYRQEMNATTLEDLQMEGRLRKALEREELCLYYQPIMDLRTRHIISLEALLRWNAPDLGLLLPDKFIPIAEASGLITPIGEWVLDTACRQYKTWHEKGSAPLRVSVNLSTQQFKRHDLADMVARSLDLYGLEAQSLEFDVNEDVMREQETTIPVLRTLKNMGSRVSIDNFGTGSYSFRFLKDFKPYAIKIDISLVKEICTSADCRDVISAIISMAHSLKLGVIATGVETEEQMDFLVEQGCDEMQGFLLSPPLPADEVPGFLQRYKNETTIAYEEIK